MQKFNSLLLFIIFSTVFTSNSLFGQVKDSDGNVYGTVKIGNNTWLTENLAVTHFRNGDEIHMATSFEDWKLYHNIQKPAYMYYAFDPVYGMKYGIMYNFYAVIDKRGLAPKDFHIPSTIEWEKLFLSVQNVGLSINDLKSKDGWLIKYTSYHADSPGKDIDSVRVINTTNNTSFNAIPTLGLIDSREGGSVDFNGADWFGDTFDLIDKLEFEDNNYSSSDASWWSSTPYNSEKAWIRKVNGERHFYGKFCGLYVRCVKD